MKLGLSIIELKQLTDEDLIERYEYAVTHNINEYHEADNLRWELQNRIKERRSN